ncbi:MAG: 3-deoxy-7-phosphoheptulonate synthase [Spirochaetales bacterium]|nr:3-deoxy-7-phosphoheptulonate synthase [Spirochaetales bacterium]
MIIVLHHGIKEQEKQAIRSNLENKGFTIREIIGEEETIFGAVGVVSIDVREVELLPGVSRVIPITKPYKLVSREFKKDDTIVPVGPIKIGGKRIVVIAGPCAIESREQIFESAYKVKDSGAVMLRGGAYKPRTSPYSFQGLEEKGLKFLKEAGEATGMPVISEIVATEQVSMMKDYVDMIQIGARNMQNFELLKRVGPIQKPILLKRGFAATIQELLMAAEYLVAHGAEYVIFCERGIRTFETYTRNTLDISAIPVIKTLSHFPVMVDPSHATGIREKVSPMALASVAAGADGVVVEVHPDPDNALSDGPQSLYPEQFEKLMRDIQALAPVLGKEISRLPDKAISITFRRESKKIDHKGKLKVSFQGERGAFSEKAIYSYFEEEVTLVPCTEFRNVFNSVLEGKSDIGVIPLENSLSGSIHQNYDLLLQFPDINIIGEKKIRIIHNLIALPGADLNEIKRVYSHPQGLAQCAKYLENFPGWEKVAYSDTAGSVAFIAKTGDKMNAAIASEEAAKVYGMHILKASIETNAQNYTRFGVIARPETVKVENPEKASFVFSTIDKPGALYLVLKILMEHSINMKKLESRPIPGKPWEYMFYVDVEVPENISIFNNCIDQLKNETEEFRLLGMYRI